MFFDEDVSALYDENQPLFTVATNQLRTKTDKTKISLKDDYRYQYCKEKNSMQSSLPFHQPELEGYGEDFTVRKESAKFVGIKPYVRSLG
ncbi:hypothetical protein Bca4012_044938 [Brassica carinata]